MIRYDCAPMEGVTTALFRALHARRFPGVGRYYTPFISPTGDHLFPPREQRELRAARASGAVPQLLTKSAEDFLWAAGELAALGFEEVNLNLGCPSGTVTAKGKGAALLADPDALARLLEAIFARCPLAVSVKTRLGMADPAEFERLLEIYNRFPLRELTIHVRTRREMYGALIHPEVFAAARERTALPLCYNGELFTAADCRALEGRFPWLGAAMLARGLAANPALVREARGGAHLTKAELRAFHDELYAAYRESYGAAVAVMRMKDLWASLRRSFRDGERLTGRIARARDPAAFEAAAAAVFAQLELADADPSKEG